MSTTLCGLEWQEICILTHKLAHTPLLDVHWLQHPLEQCGTHRVHQPHRTALTVHHIAFSELIHINVRPYIREWIKYTQVNIMLVLCPCWSSYILLHIWQYLVFLQVVDSTDERHRLRSRDIQAFEELERLICTAEKEEKYTCIRMCGILLRGILNTVVTLSCEWRQRQWLLVCIQGGKHKWAGLEGLLQLVQSDQGIIMISSLIMMISCATSKKKALLGLKGLPV